MSSDKIMEGIRAANRGDHRHAAAMYHEAGNEIRPYAEKKELWKLAQKHRDILNSD